MTPRRSANGSSCLHSLRPLSHQRRRSNRRVGPAVVSMRWSARTTIDGAAGEKRHQRSRWSCRESHPTQIATNCINTEIECAKRRQRRELHVALTCSAAVLGAAALSVAVLPLRPSIAKLSIDVSTAWPSPTLVFEPCPTDGPVMVTVRYRVPSDNLDKFLDAMRAVRKSRLRTGGHSWRLYQSAGNPGSFVEKFTVVSWTEFERQRTQRWLDYDHDFVAKALDYTADGTREHHYYLALRVP
jgi:quinol monooxygenase YgiN